MFELLFLFLAGLLSGGVNAIAGGGSFISFPALLFAGLPPVIANATNTFSACGGYLSGSFALRKELLAEKAIVIGFSIVGLLGGLAGGYLLLSTDATIFANLIPWLMLIATVLFFLGPRLNAFLAQHFAQSTRANGRLKTWGVWGATYLLMLGVSVYGGYFNAGLGIVILSCMSLLGYTHIHFMNGIKLWLSSVISIFSIIVFIANDAIAWYAGGIVLVGSVIGTYFASLYSKRVNPQLIKHIIGIVSVCLTAYFFYDVYA